MKKFIFVPIFILCFAASGFAERINPVAPSMIPNTERQMKTAGFWISRHPNPDQVVLTPTEILQFNANTHNLKLTYDLAHFPAVIDGAELHKTIEETYQKLASQEFYRANYTKTDQSFFPDLHDTLDLEKIEHQSRVRYGFIVHYADQRLLPTDEAIYAQAGDEDFDELQNSALDVGTPVIILHQTADGNWLYCRSDSSDGWIHTEQVAIGTKDDIDEFFAVKLFVINTTPKADVFLDDQLMQYYDYVQMGTRFTLIQGKWPGVLNVRLPMRGTQGELVWREGYVSSEQFNSGYLPYTPRKILEQAFKLLNQPYGWGGMYGEQDCSRFLQEVFSTTGIMLPRNSVDQIQTGKLLSAFPADAKPEDKEKLLTQEGIGGITLLGMKGHIMLYLGTMDGHWPYAIHAPWAYRELNTDNGEERTRVVNRVVVSSLSLGKGSKKGSLLQRLSRVTMVGK